MNVFVLYSSFIYFSVLFASQSIHSIFVSLLLNCLFSVCLTTFQFIYSCSLSRHLCIYSYCLHVSPRIHCLFVVTFCLTTCLLCYLTLHLFVVSSLLFDSPLIRCLFLVACTVIHCCVVANAGRRETHRTQ